MSAVNVSIEPAFTDISILLISQSPVFDLDLISDENSLSIGLTSQGYEVDLSIKDAGSDLSIGLIPFVAVNAGGATGRPSWGNYALNTLYTDEYAVSGGSVLVGTFNGVLVYHFYSTAENENGYSDDDIFYSDAELTNQLAARSDGVF